MTNETKIENRIVAVSGGFDPLHSGHVKMLVGARNFGKVIVILNSDEWIYRKKGYLLESFESRKEVLLELKSVHGVVSVDDTDGTVISALEKIKPDVFVNGGERGTRNTPEREYCFREKIAMVYGVGGFEREQISLNIKEKIFDILEKRKKEE